MPKALRFAVCISVSKEMLQCMGLLEQSFTVRMSLLRAAGALERRAIEHKLVVWMLCTLM